ncbi:hypothetical protein ACJX0J_001419 [Zea mays]
MKVQERILNLVGGFKLKNMGQKINPLGFRLGTTQNHHSFWFAQPKNYSEGLQEDKKIRNCIKNYIQKNRKKGSNRKMESDFKNRYNPPIEELEKDLQKEVNSVNQRLNIAIEKVKEPYRQPNILAEYIAFQLKNRVSFRKAMKKAIELTKKADIKGIKIQIAGRLAGKEMHVPNASKRCQNLDIRRRRITKTITLFFQKSLKKRRNFSLGMIEKLTNNNLLLRIHQYNKILKKKREFEISKSKKPNFFYYILIYALQRYRTPKRNIEDKKPLWSSKIDRYARIGDVIIAVIKDAVPQMPLERSEVIRAVIVRTRKEFKGDDGIIIRYDDNAAVIIDQKGNPKGTRVFGAVAEELRELNLTKIVSLAPEVL